MKNEEVYKQEKGKGRGQKRGKRDFKENKVKRRKKGCRKEETRARR